MEKEIILSNLGHTWIFDIDGTLVKHNGYLTAEGDTMLDGAAEFLAKNKIRYDHIIFDAPVGERIIVNDNKPGGLVTALAIERTRDSWDKLIIENE